MRAPTSRATDRRCAGRPRDRRGGFTLVELVLALAILSLLASLALPWVRPGSGQAMLRVAAADLASLLRSDRNAALLNARTVVTSIDASGSTVTAGASGRTLSLPAKMNLRVVPGGLAEVRFSRDGRSSGGRIELGRRGGGVAISVNPHTAAVLIEAR